MEDLGYIYLSGKIAGLEYEVAKKIFDDAREKVHKLGYPYEKIINPFEIRTMDTFDWADYLIRDLRENRKKAHSFGKGMNCAIIYSFGRQCISYFPRFILQR